LSESVVSLDDGNMEFEESSVTPIDLLNAFNVDQLSSDEENTNFIDIPIARRISMVYMYSQVDGAPTEETWDGRCGYLSKLCKALAIHEDRIPGLEQN